MEKNILKNSVIHIFDLVQRMKHRIVKISHDASMKQLWDIMVEDDLKMAGLESEPDAENNFNPSSHKIPSFIMGFVTYTDFLEFFLNNYEGDIKPFEVTLKDLSVYYAMNRVNQEGESVIKVIQKDEKLYSVLKKMLDYRIGMAPIVEDMKSKRTIGLFFLKDVFWLLRSGKFEFLDKSVHLLLKTIYQENQEGLSFGSEEDEEESEGESEGEIEEDEEKSFLEALREEEKFSLGLENKRSRSFIYNQSDKSVPTPGITDLGQAKDTSASLSHISGAISKEKIAGSMQKLNSGMYQSKSLDFFKPISDDKLNRFSNFSYSSEK